MMLPEIFRTTSFRFAALTAVIFSLSIAVLGAVVYTHVLDSLKTQMRERITADTSQLMGDYRDDGLKELRHDIRERIEAHPTNRLRYAISSPEGRIIFDSLPFPTTAGWHEFTLSDNTALIALVTPLDEGYRLMIGADKESLVTMKSALRSTFSYALLATLLLSALAGALVSQRFLRRVEQFTETAGRIGTISLAERMPVTGANDDFDQLSHTINQMLDRIEELMRDVRHVSTSIAHDLRTPLSALRQKLERLGQLAANKTERALCHDALEHLDTTLGTFSSLLRIAEIESSPHATQFQDIQLTPLLERLTETYQPLAEAKGQRLSFSSTAENSVMQGDKALLNQLFTNLIENALRHTPQGTDIRVLLYSEQGHPAITIADTGPGIAMEELKHITKPFYRLDRSRHTPGSGLGLSLAAAIAKRHGMHMKIESEGGLHITLYSADSIPQ